MLNTPQGVALIRSLIGAVVITAQAMIIYLLSHDEAGLGDRNTLLIGADIFLATVIGRGLIEGRIDQSSAVQRAADERKAAGPGSDLLPPP